MKKVDTILAIIIGVFILVGHTGTLLAYVEYHPFDKMVGLAISVLRLDS